MIPFSVFAGRHRALSADAFLARVKVPHLFMESELKRFDESSRFRTEKVLAEAMEVKARSKAVLLPVSKRPGSNAFPMMITLGRAPNNDMIVPDKRISSFHCYFRVAEDWMICDASSNGTWLDGDLIPRQQEVPITSGSCIKLAKALELQFLAPIDLFDRVQDAIE